MKRIICLIILCLSLQGCTLINVWGIRGNSKNPAGGYALAGGSAERLDGCFMRVLILTTEKITKAFMKSLPMVKITTDKDNNIKSAEIGVEK